MDHKTDTDAGRAALEAYLKDCDRNAIVPDVGGAFFAAFQAGRASLAASAGSEPVATSGWLHENGLLYRLTDERHPCNRDEINVTMANGSRSIEARSRRALEVLDCIISTHPSPPEGMVGGWRPIAEAPQDDTVVDIWRPSWGGERCPDMRRVDLGDGNAFYEPVLAGPTCVRDGTHFMIVHPPIAAGGGKEAG